MVIPKTIEIAGEVWRIYKENEAPKRLLKGQKQLYKNGTYGFTSYQTREIVIANGLSEHTTLETFIHEIMHAIYNASGDQHLGYDLEERIIEAQDEHYLNVILQLIECNKGNK